jgi:hypothetical protein
MLIYVVQNCITHSSRCSSTKPLSEYIELLLLLFVVDNIESDKDDVEETSAIENSLTSSRICRNSSSNSRHKLNNHYEEQCRSMQE